MPPPLLHAIYLVFCILEAIKVYDGYNSLRKRLFRTISVSKNASKDELLRASMNAFVVTQVVLYLLYLQSSQRSQLFPGITKFLPPGRVRRVRRGPGGGDPGP